MRAVFCTRCICSSLNNYHFTPYSEIGILVLLLLLTTILRYNNKYVYDIIISVFFNLYLSFFFLTVFRVQMTDACILWPREGHSESRWLRRHHVPYSLYWWLHCAARCLASMWTLKIASGIGGPKGPCSGSV